MFWYFFNGRKITKQPHLSQGTANFWHKYTGQQPVSNPLLTLSERLLSLWSTLSDINHLTSDKWANWGILFIFKASVVFQIQCMYQIIFNKTWNHSSLGNYKPMTLCLRVSQVSYLSHSSSQVPAEELCTFAYFDQGRDVSRLLSTFCCYI